jgi:fused signal recognition particle receptor
MPFWRRNREDDQAKAAEPAEPAETDDEEPLPDPEAVEPGWEPDPADFDDPAAPDGSTAPVPEWEPAAENAWSILQPGLAVPEPVYEPGPEPEPATPEPKPAAELAPLEPEHAAPEPAAPEPDHEGSLDAGLERTRGGFMSRLRGLLVGGPEGPSWDDVEETLIAGDVGAALAMDVVERARRRRDPAGAESAVRAELAALLVPRDPEWAPKPSVEGGPAVILVVGVNGTGKTTSIGKLASRYAGEGHRVILAAADTFRAAAIDQLRIWADRAGTEMVAHAPGADPGAVVYDALDAAVARGADLVIADTAGRLHTKSNLMDELSKIRRIIDKRLPGAVPETWFVLDATTGQNGLSQAVAFHEAVGLTGIVLTKLDSTSKGGIVFAIEDALHIPVRFVGVGEQAGDLIAFDPDAFVAALFA